MPTTTIRLPVELKVKVAAAAKCRGITTHRFIVDAIAAAAAQAQYQDDFEREAERRYAEIIKTGKSIPWNEMCQYLQDKIEGKPITHPGHARDE
jgi:predicted transcriptional regulator